ncbi:uncharacterized protein [Typha angustifolia]|uniref:uncharacterized protein n=1 Tax=Typha angustifolia TaxID=59011 RepID=UPI003C2D6331
MGYQITIKAAAVVWAAVMLRLVGPAIIGFLTAELPVMYGSLLGWLTPPYLYFVINGIILSIAASSRFHSPSDSAGSEPPPVIPVASRPLEFVEPELEVDVGVELTKVVETETEPEVETEKEVEAEADEFVISRSTWSPKQREMITEVPTEDSNLTDKPLVSVRFGHRKSVKPSPESKPLRVARPKRNETLESTWKTITEGRAVPLARHLKKSETWEPRGRAGASAADEAASPAMRKSETFHERGTNRGSPAPQSPASSSAGRLRREASLGQDDLNRRVEAFIKKFNEEMRLQRQESFKHYMEMIGTQ